MPCRNDCAVPLSFPTRPYNRAGLSRIGYRIGTYVDFREALMRGIDQSPLLAAWTHRAPDDPGIALLEGASILGDILTFYQELYANEAYLRTATWRDSVRDLVRLIGYRLAPGLGGKATFAIEVKGTAPIVVPAGFPIKADVQGLPKPSDFETTSEITAYPAFGRFSLYRLSIEAPIANGVTKFSIDTSDLTDAGLKLQSGDRLMLVEASSSSQPARQIVVVDSVETQFEKTEVKIKGGWQQGPVASPLRAFKLGRSFRWFGNNGPETKVSIVDGVATQSDVHFGVTLTQFVFFSEGSFGGGITIGETIADPVTTFPLDKSVDDLAAGSLMLISLNLTTGIVAPLSSLVGFAGTAPAVSSLFVRTIAGVKKGALTFGAMSGSTTFVTLDSPLASASFVTPVSTDIRSADFHEVIGPELAFRGIRQPDPTADSAHLSFFGDGATYTRLSGRAIQLVKPDAAGALVVDQAIVQTDPLQVGDASKPTLRTVKLVPAPVHFTLADFPLRNGVVTVFGNLADATQGKTERTAILGNGDSRQTFQTFKIPKSPLTYLPANAATPPQVPQTEITVDSRIWSQVPSFFEAAPDDQVYIVREDANGDSWVQFGDGITGSRLPSGVDNVVAVYRTGTGAYGPLKPGANPQAGARLDGLSKINMPAESSGGTQPESGGDARESAPGKIQSLGRLVSLRDFETEALTIPGISKVLAQWEFVDNIPSLAITILMQTGRDQEISDVKQTLDHYNICRGPQRFPIQVTQAELLYVYLDAVFAVLPSYQQDLVEAAVVQALGAVGQSSGAPDNLDGLFGLNARQFAGKEYRARIEGVMQNVEGVAWARVIGFGPLGTADDPTTLTPPAAPRPNYSQLPCASDRILALLNQHLNLQIAAPPAAGAC